MLVEARHGALEAVAEVVARGWGTPPVTAELTNHNGLQYFGKVYVGEPGQKFQVIFDTGSKDLWIPGPRCTGTGCEPHTKFQPYMSNTFARPAFSEKAISYGTGQVHVEPGKDHVRVCDERTGCFANAVVAKNRPFGLATRATDRPFRNLPFDGIFGLPPSQKSTDLVASMFRDSTASPNLQDAARPHVMGFYFSKDFARPGTAAFGGVDVAHMDKSQPLHWHNLTKAGREWTLDLVDVAVGGERLHVCPPAGCDALVDTGTSLVTGPSGKISALLGRLQPCGTNDQNPDVELIFRASDGTEVPYRLRPQDYELKFPNSDKCAHGFGPLDVGSDRWVIGNTFLRRFYSLFDDDTKQIGFVRSRHFGEAAATAPAPTLVQRVSESPAHCVLWATVQRGAATRAFL